MRRFEECLKFVLEREGGFVDRKEDRGGATNRGITQAVYSDWRLSKGMPLQSVRFISDDEVSAIYCQNYWKPCKCDNLPEPLDLLVFDGAVNSGVKQSVKWLQRALGVSDDGMMGPMTIDAAHKDADSGLLSTVVAGIIDERHDFYDAIVQRNPSQSVFLRGWMNRLQELKLAAEVV